MRTRRTLPTAAGLSLVLALVIIVGSNTNAPADRAAGASASWRLLPTAPIAGRLGASVVWTGREMIVWGGVTRSALGHAGPQAVSDGAAYNPVTRSWRRISRSPPGVLGGGGTAAAWTGHGMVVWAGNSPQGPAGGALYELRTNKWRRLSKGPLGVREGYVSAWTGKEMLIFGGHTGGVSTPTAAAVNPRTGSWRRLPAFNAVKGLAVANGAVWSGHEAFVSGNLSTGPGKPARAILIAFNPKSKRLRRIDLTNAPVDPTQRSRLTPIGWTGTEVVFTTGADVSTGVDRYNPTTGSWKKASAAPCPGTTQIAWIGDRLVAGCGSNGLQIYTPRTDIWRTIHPGRSPFNSHANSAIVWAGTNLIVWSGTVGKPGNPTPADGASLALSRALQ